MLIKLICNIFFFRIRVIIPDNLGWILYMPFDLRFINVPIIFHVAFILNMA